MKIYQFSYKKDFPLPSAAITIDCRVMVNPWDKSPTHEGRKAIVRKDPKFERLVQDGINTLTAVGEVAVGCLYGRDRSGAVAEEIAKRTGSVIIPWANRGMK